MRAGLNLYGYQIHDRITVGASPVIPNTFVFDNGGDEEGYGLEAEVEWAITNTFRFKGSYAYQQAPSETANNLGTAARHLFYGEGRWNLAPYWYFDLNLRTVLDRERAVDDPREPIDDYTLVNLSLRRKHIVNRFDLSVSVHNLFDEDAREPAPPDTLPFDIPLAGRDIYGELRIRLP